MNTNRQRLFNDLPTRGAQLTCVFRIYAYHCDTGTFSLVSQDALERCPSNVRDRLGESTVLDHALDVQAFRSNHPESTGQFVSGFEVKLPADVFNFGVEFLDFLYCFAVVTSKFLFSGKAALSPSQLGEFRLQE